MSVSSTQPVLLIGSKGQVGRALYPRLQAVGSVVSAAREGADEVVDLADEQNICSLLSSVRPRMVVNAAAYTAVDAAEDDATTATQINGIAPGILARECNSMGIPLVHYSTDYVFDGDAQKPWRESDVPAPLGVYGRSKLAGDRAIAAGGGAYLILRTGWVYDESGHNFLRTMLRLFAERDAVSVVSDQFGAPTSANAIAKCTLAILQRIDFATQSGLYNLSCGGETSWFGFASEILARSGLACELAAISTDQYPTPARRPRYSVLSSEHLHQTFDLEMPGWKDALVECMARL